MNVMWVLMSSRSRAFIVSNTWENTGKLRMSSRPTCCHCFDYLGKYWETTDEFTSPRVVILGNYWDCYYKKRARLSECKESTCEIMDDSMIVGRVMLLNDLPPAECTRSKRPAQQIEVKTPKRRAKGVKQRRLYFVTPRRLAYLYGSDFWLGSGMLKSTSLLLC